MHRRIGAGQRLKVLLATVFLFGGAVSCGKDEADTGSGRMGAPSTPVAETQYGLVSGAKEQEILVFKGIRYGADTATTRFAAPAAPQPWEAAQDATAFGASCPQRGEFNPGGLFTSWQPVPAPPLSEDCLVLNVWTPALADGAQRPVMVWFHGGSFSTGSGASRAYDGVRLARRGDVVVVTVNHRLNAFGYASLGHYGEGFEESPVAGVLDMIAALRWVRDNIRNFGGDPDTVMISGESGGAAKVSTLMAAEGAKGLFHRAVLQSGAFTKFLPEDVARKAADQMVANLGLTAETIQQIKTLPIEAIQEAAASTGTGSAPTIDGQVLRHHPFDPVAAPPGRDVPLMLGTNRTEVSLFFAGNPEVFDLNWDTLRAALSRFYPDADVDKIIATYRSLQPKSSSSDIFLEALTDASYLRAHVLQAEKKVQQGGASTFMYLFNWDTPVDGGKWRSPHALELGFVFDNVAFSESMSGVGEAQQRVADIMADTWIAFARNGRPDNARLPGWPEYNLETRPVMVLDESPELVNDARGVQRSLLDGSDRHLNRYVPDTR